MFLSEVTICENLHPLISNVFWEQLNVYHSSEIRYNGINYQNLFTTFNTQTVYNFLGDLLFDVSNTHDFIQVDMEYCINGKTIENIDCFRKVHLKYNEVTKRIAETGIKSSTKCAKDWENMFLKMYCYEKHIALFNANSKKTLDENDLQEMIKYINILKRLLLENQYVVFGFGTLKHYF